MNGELLPGNFWVKYPADDSEALHRLRLSEYLTNLSGEGAAAEQWALLEPAPADGEERACRPARACGVCQPARLRRAVVS